MNHDFTKKHTIANMTMATVSSRTGAEQPTSELVALKQIEDPEKPSK